MLEIVNLKQPNLFKGKGIRYIEYIYRKKEIQEKKNDTYNKIFNFCR